MPPQQTKTDASALGELKEVIRRQAAEIETLQKKLKEGQSASASSTSSSSGHGPPASEDAEALAKYLTTPFFMLAFRRIGWLSLFLCSLSLTAVIMNGFEHTLSRHIELAYFVPLLAGHGGNTGGQTVGTVLSALSVGAVTPSDALAVVAKEATSGFTVGLLLGAALGPVAHFLGGVSAHVSTVVFCTLPLTSTIAATLASSIPFACKAVGLDPAVIAAPAMTTLVDVTGLLSYFVIANRVFRAFGLEL